MKNGKLIIRQLDNKIILLAPLQHISFHNTGWVHTMRTSLHMSLKQLGHRMSMTPQSVSDIERREIEGTVTLNTLKDAANGLGMKLVYGFIPIEGTLEKMIERKAMEMAQKIVARTSVSMKLENQENSGERLTEAINELAAQIKQEIPKQLWD